MKCVGNLQLSAADGTAGFDGGIVSVMRASTIILVEPSVRS